MLTRRSLLALTGGVGAALGLGRGFPRAAAEGAQAPATGYLQGVVGQYGITDPCHTHYFLYVHQHRAWAEGSTRTAPAGAGRD